MKRLILAIILLATTTTTACTTSKHQSSTESPLHLLRQAGITCPSAPTVAGTDCRYHHDQITVSSATWADTQTLRRQACTAGYVNSRYRVAAGRGIVIAPGTTDPAVFARLIPGLTVRRYCA